MSAAGLIKRFARRLGVDIRRYHPGGSESYRFAATLRSQQVNVVFDVGANTGQFGRELRGLGYRGRIVSFEPLSTARKQLLRTSEPDSCWDIAPQAALGASEGEVEIHIAGNSVSSSILGMLEAHSSVAPESRYVGVERVPLARLDTLAEPYLGEDSVAFLKIDTQGYERQVLQGATRLLDRVKGCQLELSLTPLYEGQEAYTDLIAHMVGLGMQLWDMSPVFADPASGRLLQVDATFIRQR